MNSNSILKLLILSLCLVLLLCLTACKDGAAPDGTSSSAGVQESISSTESGEPETSGNAGDAQSGATDKSTSSGDKTLQGIELEEDVFDNSDIQNNPQNNSSGNTSSGNQSDDSVSDNNSPDDNVSEENTSSSDGTVKLPVDWFD